jgi:DNA-binding XRE family transcriptional regulator
MEDLAKHAGVSKNTVNHLEKDQPSNLSTQEQLRRTFEAHGIEFINSNGLRVKKSPSGEGG